MSTLTFTNLSYARNEQLLFADLNGTVNAGELLQVQGANGSGKTTLLKLLAGFLQPLTGKITWQAEAVYFNDDYHTNIQYLSHQNSLKLNLSIRDNLHFFSALQQETISAVQIETILNHFELDTIQHKLAHTLSAGQKRRVALTRLLIKPAKLWIVDEPATSLDKKGQEQLALLFSQHLQNQGSIILATHQPLAVDGIHKKINLDERHAKSY